MTKERSWMKDGEKVFQLVHFSRFTDDYEEEKTRADLFSFISQIENAAIERVLGEVERKIEKEAPVKGTNEQVEAAHCGLYHWNDCRTAVLELIKSIRNKELT